MKQPMMRVFSAFALAFCMVAATVHAGTEPAGSMAAARQSHVSVSLPGGRALVAGGFMPSSASATSSAEVFDAATATFSAAPAMSTARAYAVGAILPDGRALVAGGTPVNQSPPINLASAEIYDPTTNSWSAAASMAVGRQGAVAVVLSDGRVLVIGGDATRAASEIYDPAAGVFVATGSLATARSNFAASLLPDGRVLVVGGRDSNLTPFASAEIWDPATGLWSAAGTMASARSSPTATPLADGKVLIAGGIATSSWSSAVAAAELYDPATGAFSATGSLSTARHGHMAARLGSGDIVVAGGTNSGSMITAVIERYDVATGTWAAGGSLASERHVSAAASLSNGEVLIAGGNSYAGTVNTAELIDAACIATLASISPTSATYTSDAASGSIAVTHTAGCAWRVSNVPSWMTVTSTVPGFGSSTLTYTIAENTTTFGRGATVRIADTTFAINQSAHPCASASLSPTSQSFGYTGGFGSTSLTASASCSWSVTGAPAWITVNTPSGSGSGSISYNVASNPGVARSTSLTIAGRGFTVSQSANPCGSGPTISPTSRVIPFSGGNSSVTVTAGSGCAWSVVGAPPWITIASSGSGSATLNFSVASNAGGAERSASFTVAGNTFTVTQLADLCVGASLSPSSLALPNTATSGTIALTAPSACAWTISGLPSWLTFPSGTSGTGSATLTYQAAANSSTGSARSATVSVAGLSLPVSQAAGPCAGSTVSPTTSPTFPTSGGTGSMTVTAPAACTWSVTGAPAWVTVTTPMPMTGTGTVSYSVAANTGSARNATLTAAGATHAIAQAGAVTYCASRGNNSSYEWIQQISIAGQSRNTGNNGGYANFTTSTAPITLSRTQTIAVSPGFSSGAYTENWRIWIDMNGDSIFSDNEIVFSGTSNGPIGSSITIPTWAPVGATTRMRISMKWGGMPSPCETFSYGEVEDYTVVLP